jgi:hypothetical protein
MERVLPPAGVGSGRGWLLVARVQVPEHGDLLWQTAVQAPVDSHHRNLKHLGRFSLRQPLDLFRVERFALRRAGEWWGADSSHNPATASHYI